MFSLAGRVAGRWLVVAVGVECQFAEELAGAGVGDADVEVADQEQDADCGVRPAGAEAAGFPARARSQFFMVCWNRSTLPWVWG